MDCVYGKRETEDFRGEPGWEVYRRWDDDPDFDSDEVIAIVDTETLADILIAALEVVAYN